MSSQKKLRLAEVFPPSDFIVEELEARGWNIEDLAFFSGCSVQALERVVRENKPLKHDVAVGLGKAFGTSWELWRNLDVAYRSRKEQPKKPRPASVVPRAASAARKAKRVSPRADADIVAASRARVAPKRKRTSKAQTTEPGR